VLSRSERGVTWLVLLVVSLIILYPLAILLSAALEPLDQGAIGISFSHALSFQSFSYAWTVGDFRTYLWNTVLVTVAVVVMSAVISVLAAFGISVLRPYGSRLLLYVAILGFMLPTEALIVPWYYQMTSLNFLNTYWAMILPQAAQSVAFGTFWMVTAFASLPRSLGEAAALDGASQWNLLWKVHVPNLSPAIKTMAALVFLWTWNSFLLPLVMESNTNRYVVTIGLSSFQGSHFGNYSALAAGSLLTALPVIVVYLFAQRSFISGMFAGSVVE
jgi:raffinose/stachyose/melibiose transport system permease protein